MAPKRRRVRVRWRVLAVVLTLLAGGGLWLGIAVTHKPTWYAPPDRNSEAVVELGHDTQNRVITQVHRVRGDDPSWTLRLTEDEMNAWLAVNLPGWLESETGRTWPDDVSLPVVHVGADGVTVGVLIPEHFGDRVVSIRVLPEVTEAGDVIVRADRVALNALALPGPVARHTLGVVRELVGDRATNQSFDRVVAVLFKTPRCRLSSTLGDERVVRVLNVTLGEGFAELRCVTEVEGSLRGETIGLQSPQERER